jgi:hypothetical protein
MEPCITSSSASPEGRVHVICIQNLTSGSDPEGWLMVTSNSLFSIDDLDLMLIITTTAAKEACRSYDDCRQHRTGKVSA